MYFWGKNGTFTNAGGDGILAYYLQRGQSSGIKAFPTGFRMIGGSPVLRSQHGDVPSQKYGAASFACLGSGKAETPYLPPYNCPDGLRAQLFFPVSAAALHLGYDGDLCAELLGW